MDGCFVGVAHMPCAGRSTFSPIAPNRHRQTPIREAGDDLLMIDPAYACTDLVGQNHAISGGNTGNQGYSLAKVS